MAKDIVCGMEISPSSPYRSEYRGRSYAFCSPACRERFVDRPDAYVADAVSSHETADASVRATVRYTCPMHPDVIRDGPGACPKCGMALEPMSAAGEDERSDELAAMLRRLVISGALTLPLFVAAMAGEWLLSVIPVTEAVLQWIEFALASPVIVWGGWPFFVRGWMSVKTGQLNMFTLIALGIGVAYGYSAVAIAMPQLFPPLMRTKEGLVAVYFEVAAVITTLVLLGQVLELNARSKTNSAIKLLLNLSPKRAHRIDAQGREEEIRIDDVRAGDHLRIKPGEKIPVDGLVLEGQSNVDESMITGESVAVAKAPGEWLIGATINKNGTLVMRAERVGRETMLARIVEMVSQAQRSRAPIQKLADTVSGYFVPAVVGAALLSFAGWWIWGPEPRLASAVVAAVAVLIIACPCALGLATPISIMVGTGRAALAGILIKDARTLEQMEKVTTLVVDKTGTLTQGSPTVTGYVTAAGAVREDVLRFGASLERASEHPLAEAVVDYAAKQGAFPVGVADFEAVTGRGIVGTIEGRSIVMGSDTFLQEREISCDMLSDQARQWRTEGRTVVFLAIDSRVCGMFGIEDPLKPTSQEAIAMLQREGIRVVMLSGDNQTTAQAVAQRIHIHDVYAHVLPEDKAVIIRQLRDEGAVVAMAGDGINDAPALASADVGIAMGTGTDVAIESAGITLIKGDLTGIVKVRQLSRATMKNIRQNLFFAFIYNIAGIPIAAGALYPVFGVLLSPVVAAAAMSFSSVSVIGNALRLRGIRLGS